QKVARRMDLADGLVGQLTKAGLRADARGDVVRVYGWRGRFGVLRPAVGGGVVSTPDRDREIPRVTGLPRPAPYLEIDFAPAAPAAGRKVTLSLELATAEGEPFRLERSFGALFV